MRLSMISAALVASLVGYGSTIALLLSAAAAVGASPEQTASWVLAVCLVKAAGSAWLSWRHKVPVVLAWSTAGAALIAATEATSMAETVGAFLVSGALVVATGLVRPLGRLVARIPDGIAGAMLAGILLPFCLRAAGATEALPLVIGPMILVFTLVRLWNPATAVLAALAVGLALAFGSGVAILPELRLAAPQLSFIPPEFDLTVMLGLGIPLYLVTMASQNLPGFATMRSHGFEPPVRDALITTGGLSAFGGLFGASPISMAAITAAICMGDDVHPDRGQRWKVGLAYGVVWLGLGLFSPLILQLLAALPPEVMAALVAIALLGPLMGALTTAMAAAPQRFGAVVTLTVTASGVSVLGIGSAFWGLGCGVIVHLLDEARARQKAARAA